MAKKTRISSLEAKNLSNSFTHAKYKSPCILARLLLEAFIFEDGNINSDWFIREKACTKGSFTKLRNRLIEDQWLLFRDDTLRYLPGIRLRPHLEALKEVKLASIAHVEAIDAKKADRSELAALDAKKADKSELEITRMQLEKTNSKLEEHTRRIQGIAIAVAELEAAMAPPDDAEKKKIRTQSVLKINALSSN